MLREIQGADELHMQLFVDDALSTIRPMLAKADGLIHGHAANDDEGEGRQSDIDALFD